MKLIRHSVFETNSSSCHSVSVTSDTKLTDIPTPNKNGDVLIELEGTYGWEQDIYGNFYDKVDYLGIYARDWAGDRSEEFTQILCDVIKEVSGANEVMIVSKKDMSWGDGKYDMGGIDHQSVEDQDYHYLFEDTDTLKRFLFNTGSYFQTDNDNGYY